MRQTARVVVIGGGVVGASVLYHLAKAGWSDILLVERDQLTSGSTWHAAGGMHTLNSDPNVAKLQAYTIELYKEIEELSGQSCGVHLTGGVMLAGTKERLDLLKAMHAKGRYLGMKTEVISAREAAELMPLLDPKHFTGALFDPIEGHVDPYGVTHAYVKAARLKGAEVVLQNRVVELNQRPDATWDVVTEQGTVHAEHVVNAGGLWAREVGRMVGLELPVLAMEHQYLITEDMPEVLASPTELLHAIDFEAEIYLRQERGGMLLGTYERAGVPWSEKTTPWDFSTQLLPEDLDRIAPSLEVGFEHFPAIGRAGIKRVINGPFTFAPDGNPLVGPVRGLPNYWCACAVMAGFSQGGGVGLALANWITQGDPGFDVWAMDVARYGPWATPGYTNAKVRENYSRRFRITFPNEELPAARPLKTTSIYDLLTAENAVMGVAYGQEHALWFAPPGTEPVESVTFGRSNAHAHVAEECRAVREAAGLIEISNFAKYRIAGPGAERWLARLLAGRIPKTGRISLTPMLNDRGRLIGDFTLARLAPDRFLLTGSGIAESYHLRWFEQHLPATGVTLRSVTDSLLGLSVAGPASRAVLAELTGEDLSADAFPFLAIRPLELALVPTLAGRISYTGGLGYEIWTEAPYLRRLYQALRRAGEPFGLKLFGGRALNSLRLEKGFGSWAREYRPLYGPRAAGLDRFVDYRRGGFIGHAAAEEETPTHRLVTLTVQDTDIDVMGDEPIWLGDRVVGWVTSGGYAHHKQASVALGYIAAGHESATDLAIEILGNRRPASIVDRPLFDPDGRRMRG
jgi:dimethylglycine dehydrogenase